MPKHCVGQKIRSVRKAHKLSQVDMSKRLGVSQQAYSTYETDTVVIPLPRLFQFCDIFGMSLARFMAVHTQEVSKNAR
jgi:transcriptional regulator with XRE-family HTH domain